jgi:predicted TIM-barrel fold metal-dependent hydrolase
MATISCTASTEPAKPITDRAAKRRDSIILNTAKRPLSNTCACCIPPLAANVVSRRQVLGGAAAIAMGAAVSFPGKSSAQSTPRRIDVHHHFASPSWLQAMDLIGADDPVIGNWSVQKSLDDMDKGGVVTAVLSCTPPQVRPLGREAATRIARESNEYAKRLAMDHPGRFGLFATLPLPYIDESLKEIAYALDTLKADGVGILTNYNDKWLGYSYFDPIWDELNRRKATVYTHPVDASCCVNLVQGVPGAALEWGADTTRSITSLIFSGTSQKYRDINWIFSHGGGALTALAERLLAQMVTTPPYQGKFTRDMVQAELNRFHYDTAQVSLDGTLAALAKLVPISRIMYGTDFPYRTAVEHSKGVDAIFDVEDRKQVNRENALSILPRLRGT